MSTSRCSSGLSAATSFMRPPQGLNARAPAPAVPSRVRQLSSGRVFAGFQEADVGPALKRQLQVDARGGEVDERAAVIEREVLESAGAELLELPAVRRV